MKTLVSKTFRIADYEVVVHLRKGHEFDDIIRAFAPALAPYAMAIVNAHSSCFSEKFQEAYEKRNKVRLPVHPRHREPTIALDPTLKSFASMR
jgi:hypothetical protein